MLAEALAYAKRGWYVFPLHHPIASGCSCSKDCDSPAKHPRTAKGLLDATRDQAQIRRWWKTWPEANIGVRTGKISGIVVVDTDLKNDGPKNWSELQDVHGAVETLTARTGGGGEHWIFLAPSDRQLKNTTSVIARGIDTRAEGGYIVAPPSLHMSGQRYE